MRPLILSRDRPAHGTFVKIDSPPVIELLGLAGLDFAVVDAEHGPFDRPALDRLLLAARAADLPTLVRVADLAAASLQAPLDLGAAGLVLPRVDGALEAREVVAMARFRGGRRGFSVSPRFAGYGTMPRAEVLAAGDAARLICQVESASALAEVDAIAAVPGVDALLIGRADLALSLGLEDPKHPAMDAAVGRIIEAARGAGKVCAMHVGDVAEARRFAARGVSWFVISSDQGLLLQGARALAQAAAAAPGAAALPPVEDVLR